MVAIAGIFCQFGRRERIAQLDVVAADMLARAPGGFDVGYAAGVNLAQGRCLGASRRSDRSIVTGLTRLHHCTIVFDGRIDDRSHLAAAIGIRDCPIAEMSDAELVLHAYLRWEERTAERLLGDFAFAVVDERERRLYMARDHMGNRPLHLVSRRGLVAFSSDDEALVALPEVRPRPNLALVACLFFDPLWSVVHNSDWLADAPLLAPGHSVTVNLATGRTHHAQYWDPHRFMRPVRRTFADALSEYRTVLDLAVASRTAGLRRPAMLMSGGLDSAVLADSLSRLSQASKISEFESFSVLRTDGVDCRETSRIRRLQELPGCVAHSLSANDVPEDVWEAYDHVARTRPHPVVLSLPLVLLGADWARQRGHCTLLNGGAGDVCNETHNSYLRHYVSEIGYLAAWREAVAADRHHTFLRSHGPIRLFAKALVAAAATNGGLRMLARAHVWANYSRSHLRMREAGFDGWITAHAGLFALLRDGAAELASQVPMAFSAMRYATIWPNGASHGLESYDRISANFGVASADPFADRRVVEFFGGLTVENLTRGGRTKALARASLPDALTTVIESNDKIHLGGLLVDRQERTFRNLAANGDSVRSAKAPDQSDADVIFLDSVLRSVSEIAKQQDRMERWRKVNYLAAADAWLRRLRTTAARAH